MSGTSDTPEFSAYELMKGGGRRSPRTGEGGKPTPGPSRIREGGSAGDTAADIGACEGGGFADGDGARQVPAFTGKQGGNAGKQGVNAGKQGVNAGKPGANATRQGGDAGEQVGRVPATKPKSAPKPRHNAWTQTKMAAFLRELAASQSVAGAARSVGMSRQSAYRLKNRLAATPFALGWEVALEAGFAQLAHAMMDRAINGVEVPHYYQGELVGTSRAYDERLAIWIANNPWKVGRQQVAREFSAEGFDRLIERIEYGPLDWGADCAAHDGLGDGGGEAGEPGDYSGGYIDTPPGLEDVPATHDEAQAQQRAFLNTRSWYAAQVEEARGLRRK